MDEKNHDDLLDQYVMGKLQGEQLTKFEQQLSFDAQLRRQVELEKAIIKNIRSVGRQEYRLKLKNLHQKVQEATSEASSNKAESKHIQLQSRDNHKPNRSYWLIAASVLLLVVGSLIIALYFTDRSDADAVFISYYEPYPSAYTERGQPENADLRTAAFNTYSQGKYPESIELFERILLTEEDEEILFYLGNAYLSADRPKEAETTFMQYLSKYQEFSVEASWYLSLSYLKQSKLSEATQLLEQIAAENNDYSEKASEILEVLD